MRENQGYGRHAEHRGSFCKDGPKSIRPLDSFPECRHFDARHKIVPVPPIGGNNIKFAINVILYRLI